MTRVDPSKLECLAILQRQGKRRRDIEQAMKISTRTYFRYLEEIRRVMNEVKRLEAIEA